MNFNQIFGLLMSSGSCIYIYRSPRRRTRFRRAMVTWIHHWKQCNFGNQNFVTIDSFSESPYKKQYCNALYKYSPKTRLFMTGRRLKVVMIRFYSDSDSFWKHFISIRFRFLSEVFNSIRFRFLSKHLISIQF